MLHFSRAIARIPGNSLQQGISSSPGGVPDTQRARRQHHEYIQALEALGLDVFVLPADEKFPDSVFVEDTAVFMGAGVLVTRPGADTRLGEGMAMRAHLQNLEHQVVVMQTPGSLDGGDVLLVGKRFFVGMSQRTNGEGLRQFSDAAARFGYETRAVPVPAGLHLKSGLSLVGEGLLLAAPGCAQDPAFAGLRVLCVPAHEAYAANSLSVNGTVLVPAGYPETTSLLQAEGLQTREVDVSEFRKVDGGLSCLSLRF